MNSNVNSTIISMSAAHLATLTTEVKETVANESFEPNKTFSVIDLWNIQRQRKTQNLSKRAMVSRRNTIL